MVRRVYAGGYMPNVSIVVPLRSSQPAASSASATKQRPIVIDPTDRRDRALRLVTGAAIIVAVILIAWLRPGAWVALVVLLLGAALARAAGWSGRNLRLVAIAPAVAVAAIDYLAWRTTVLSWAGWFIGIQLLLAEAHAALHALGLQVTMWPSRMRPPRRDTDPTRRPIVVFVPTVDEGPAILGQTLRGILLARDTFLRRYPHARIEVVVCNDGGVAGADCSDEVIALSRRLGVTCITRTVGGGAKAGNIENARQMVGATGDALVVIFDADQIPTADFLTATVPWFTDTSIGWVQTGQYYRNRGNPVTRWADDQQSLFYRLLCPAKATRSAAFICGTNVVVSARALDEIGGLPRDSVTEDFAASVLLAPRWKCVFLRGIYAAGLGPMDFPAYLKQQERWARGTLTVLRRYGRRLVAPGSGLSADQRVQYALAMTHYLSGLRDTIFVIAPILFILTGISGVQGATTGQFFEHFVPYYALTMFAFWHAAAGATSWRSVAIGFASAPALVSATWATVTGRTARFTITPKTRGGAGSLRVAAPYAIGLALCLVAIAVAVVERRWPAVYLAAVWTCYLAVLFAVTLGLIAADVRAGRATSSAVTAAPILRSETSGRLRPRRDVRWGSRFFLVGIAAAALLSWFAIGEAAGNRSAPAPSASSADVLRSVGTGTRAGVSGADEARVARLATTTFPNGAVAGRSFEIADRFDSDWAQRVVANGGTPWITLLFSTSGRPGLDSSLTAIDNGIHDEALRRWAGEIAAFGTPVYLTVLPLVDRDFVASSAVARGGIPADAAPAWRHIREVFDAGGARNVAWVWGPADPADDGAYAPDADLIDVVALTWYAYPGTAWVDPATELSTVARRYPDRPLLLEVSAPPSQICTPAVDTGVDCERTDSAFTDRAQWLAAVRLAVAGQPAVAAVVYHDGGPFIDPTDPRALPWRMPDPAQWLPMAAGQVR